MASPFTFISVALDGKGIQSDRRGRGISNNDRYKIRSMAARMSDHSRGKGESPDLPAPPPPSASPPRRGRRVAPKSRQVGRSSALTSVSDTDTSQSGTSSSWSEDGKAAQVSFLELPDDSTFFCGESTADCIDIDEFDDDCMFDDNTSQSSSLTFLNDADDDVIELDRSDAFTIDEFDAANGVNPLTVAFAKQIPGLVQSDGIDPFWSFSIPYRPFLSRAINHLTTEMCPRLPGLDSKGENTSLALLTKFFHNPAFLFGGALASSWLIYEQQQKYGAANARDLVKPQDLIWLKGSALATLNAQLCNPNMTKFDIENCISGVLSIAIVEGYHGDSETCEMHLKGFDRLLSMLGGVKGTSPIFQKYWSWVAANASVVFPRLDNPLYQNSDPYWSGLSSRMVDT